jgi:hypothetical protein
VNLEWTLFVGSQMSNTLGGSSYHAPTIMYSSASGALDTRGGQQVTLTGAHFGPLGTAVSVGYGNTSCTHYTATQCSVLIADTVITCKSVSGTGSQLHVSVLVGQQRSNCSADSISYKSPVLTSVTGRGALSSSTAGGKDMEHVLDGNLTDVGIL